MPKYPLIIIPGSPVVLKNSKNVFRGRVTHSKKVKNRMEPDLWLVKSKWALPPLNHRISLKIMSYGAWFKSDGNIPDASNLYQYPEDILEKAGIITNDRLVEHHDGSRRVYLCEICGRKSMRPRKKDWIKCGNVKKCPLEKVTVEIITL